MYHPGTFHAARHTYDRMDYCRAIFIPDVEVVSRAVLVDYSSV
jgi:hypothetical protein